MRKLVNLFMILSMITMSFIFVIPLVSLLWQLAEKAAPRLSLDLITSVGGQLGESGGLLQAIIGTLVMVTLAAVVAVPVGILTALALSESRSRLFKTPVEFSVDLLIGAPSIIIGIFVYFLLVVPFRQYSALAGSCALAIIIFPIIVKTSVEIFRLFPMSVKQAGLALGLKRYQVSLYVVIWGSRKELLPGILNSLARASGETAPLLFTAFGSPFIIRGLLEPTSAMPLQIFHYATSPYPEWNELAWSGSFLLVSFIFFIQICSRILTRTKQG